MNLKVLLCITVCMLCGVNTIQGMKRIITLRADLCDLESSQSDSANLGFNLLGFDAPEKPSRLTLISGTQPKRKLQAKQTKQELITRKAVTLKRSNYGKTLYKQYLAAIRNRIASERLVIKD